MDLDTTYCRLGALLRLHAPWAHEHQLSTLASNASILMKHNFGVPRKPATVDLVLTLHRRQANQTSAGGPSRRTVPKRSVWRKRHYGNTGLPSAPSEPTLVPSDPSFHDPEHSPRTFPEEDSLPFQSKADGKKPVEELESDKGSPSTNHQGPDPNVYVIVSIIRVMVDEPIRVLIKVSTENSNSWDAWVDLLEDAVAEAVQRVMDEKADRPLYGLEYM